MRRFAGPVLSVWVIAAWAFCAPVAHAATWIVDSARSSVTFGYVEDGIARTGTFTRFTAEVFFDPAALGQTSAAVSVATTSLDLGDAMREGVLETTPWFDTERFDTARLVVTALTPVPGMAGAYTADATLGIKGLERPLRFRTEVSVADGTGRARGSFSITRTDFRLRDAVLEAMVPIGDEVKIAFDLYARKAGT